MSPIFALLWSDLSLAAEVASSLDPAGWQALDQQANQHRLRPFLYQRAMHGDWGVPPDLMRIWQASHERSALRALAQKAAAARIGKTLGAGGVSAALLKGGTFVWSGAINSAVRPMRDIDLLIRPEDADAATELLRSIGYVMDERSRPSLKHLPALTSGRVVVELHLQVFEAYEDRAAMRARNFVDRAWQRTVPAGLGGLQAFGPTDTLLHLIAHAVFDHQFNNGPLLLLDMATLVQGSGIDWALFWDEAERNQMTRACQLALGFAQRVSGLVVDWQGHSPPDLGDKELEKVARLMLVDMTNRSAVGWPGQLLRLSPQRWPAQLAAMVRRRGDGVAGLSGRQGEPGLGEALHYAVGAEGRSMIADAVRLALWLRRD